LAAAIECLTKRDPRQVTPRRLLEKVQSHLDRTTGSIPEVGDVFNAAFTTTGGADIDLSLDTQCNRRADHVPNGIGGYADGVCDPAGGYTFTDVARENFGKINVKRGHRVIEFVLKYYF
jgi:hypothetical protein